MAWRRLVLSLAWSGCAAGMLGGCAGLIPKQVLKQADPSATFKAVQGHVEAYKGKPIVWGGEILNLRNAKDGTYVEILQSPTDKKGTPKDKELSEGRFLAFTPEYLDRKIYSAERKVSVDGLIEGIQRQPLAEGEAEYPYPVVRARKLYLWPLPEKPDTSPRVNFGLGVGLGF